MADTETDEAICYTAQALPGLSSIDLLLLDFGPRCPYRTSSAYA